MEESKLNIIKFKKVITPWGVDAVLPSRATAKSAGYDFSSCETVEIKPKEVKLIHTGIKAQFPENVVLQLFDRSSNPRKRGIVLANSVGIIDSDYYGNINNDGEIMGQFLNITDHAVTIEKGQRMMQGIFLPFFLANNDSASGERIGGFGSSD